VGKRERAGAVDARCAKSWPATAWSANFRSMRMGNLDRRGIATPASCAVCGITDARVLATTRLLDGDRVVVCGSHKVAHHRSDRIATSIDELCMLVGDRRKSA
jgi:hypothetical protein